MPQVDITKGGDKGMEIAINDMVTLGYLKSAPKIIDTHAAARSARLSAMSGAGCRSRPSPRRGAARRRSASLPSLGSRRRPRRSLPWAVVIAMWEIAAARGWSGAVLFPPPSSFISYAIESDFRVGFGREAMTIPMAIVASALRVLAGLASASWRRSLPAS